MHMKYGESKLQNSEQLEHEKKRRKKRIWWLV